MAAKSANISVRVEPEIKEQAEKILERVGVSVSALINMTYRQVILRNGIPFSVTIPTELESLDTMSDEEFDEMMQTGLMQAKAGETIPCEAAFDQPKKVQVTAVVYIRQNQTTELMKMLPDEE